MNESSLDACAGAYAETGEYDLDHGLTLEWYARRVLELCSRDSLLELGVGFGAATRLFSKHCARHVVVEGSRKVIDAFTARGECPNTEMVHSRFEDFDTRERFDSVVLGFVLEHVDDPALVLGRFREFMKPGGRMYVAVPNAESLHRRLGHLAGMLDDLHALNDYDRRVGHKRFFDLESLHGVARRAGLEPVRTEGIFLKPFTTSQLTSLSLSPKVLEALMIVGTDYPELSNALLCEMRAGA